MKLRKIFSALLALCMIAGALNIALPASAADNPSYLVTGEVSGGSFVVRVYLRNALSYGGRLALAYDSDILELTNASSFEQAVTQPPGVTLTTEGHADSVLIGNGHVMLAWYSADYAGLDASGSDKEIASVRFNLTDGASTADFSRNTLGLYYVNETMVDGWDSSSEIIASENDFLTAYRNTAVDETRLCGVSFDYPNCDYIPIETYKVSANVRNTDGKALVASVQLDTVSAETDIYGHADIQMQSGRYFYRVTSPGYETKFGYFIVDNQDEAFNITLRSYGQVARDEVNALLIGYAEGDSELGVTTDLVLPTETKYGTVSWSSDNGAVNEYGGVSRGDDDVAVTLTATVNVNGAEASRDFEIIVKSRLTAEQKNMAIVSQDKADLAIGYAPGDSDDYVTADLLLPEAGAKGSSIVWASSDENIISYMGSVARPENDTEVTLTAYIIRGTVSDTKKFTVTVKGANDEYGLGDKSKIDESIYESNEIVQRVLNVLEIGYAKDDSAASVKNKLTLPSVGTEGTTITWTSSLPAVVTPYGGVVRQAEDTEVTLTATISRGEVSAQKTFTVMVKAADEIPQNPNNGQEKEIELRNTGGSGGGGGAAGSESVAEATATPVPTTEPVPSEAPAADKSNNKKFTDIDNVPWAQTAINSLTERGVINGTSDTTYSPNNNIRRADFVMLLMKLYELDAEITETFEDVIEDNYYYESLSKAKSLGIISGIDETHFNPESSISRQDMMTMTYRALQKLGMADTMEEADISAFRDANEISDYALDSVRHLVGGGYIHGDNSGHVTPRSNTTRAETAVFLYGLVQ